MADIIKHQGVVEELNGTHVVVRIVQTSACSACSIKGHCNASESKDKWIDVYNVREGMYKKGEEVTVCGTTRMGMQAVILAFGVPFLVVMLALVVSLQVTGGNEWLSALIALVALLPYYVMVYLYRKKLTKRFSFYIETK